MSHLPEETETGGPNYRIGADYAGNADFSAKFSSFIYKNDN